MNFELKSSKLFWHNNYFYRLDFILSFCFFYIKIGKWTAKLNILVAK